MFRYGAAQKLGVMWTTQKVVMLNVGPEWEWQCPKDWEKYLAQYLSADSQGAHMLDTRDLY